MPGPFSKEPCLPDLALVPGGILKKPDTDTLKLRASSLLAATLRSLSDEDRARLAELIQRED